MKINPPELIQESIVGRLCKEKGQQEATKILTRKSIIRIIKRAKGYQLSYENKKQIEGIQELEKLEAILTEIWNVNDMNKITATINKYDWLKEMERLDAEYYGRIV